MSPASGIPLLHQLARLYGIQTAYYDAFHRRRSAPAETLLAVLRSLGAPVSALQDIPSAWRQRQQGWWQRWLEPVTVAWDGGLPLVEVRLSPEHAGGRLDAHLKLENGESRRWEWRGADLTVLKAAEVEGVRYLAQGLRLPGEVPWGYHRLTLEGGGESAEALVISAPRRAYAPPPAGNRAWGVFLPLYSLHTERSWGCGDLSDWAALTDWVAGMGGGVAATLPFLAAFLDEPYQPSPYAPASRLLWNEFYLDVAGVPELQQCAPARAMMASTQFQDEVEALRRLSLVDYRRQMALKRRVLEELCRCFFAAGSARLEELRRFTGAHPVVEDYARFRAAGEKRRAPWRSWPPPLREGVLKSGDYDEEARRYHLYVQWLTCQQVESLSRRAGEKGLEMYLDLPLGVHPDGYDVWRERRAFAPGAAAGAPPDAVFTRGQNWWCPPPHPEGMREQGYRYTIAYLRHHLRHAGILRLDHVMGLHRLFWIPEGMEAAQGAYVRYPAEELYAILSLESRRHSCVIVGEDLGTVPPEVRPSMSRHGLHRMYVLHYELETSRKLGLPTVSRNSVASLNTHDMPPFAAFWPGLDIDSRLESGLLDRAGARAERKGRQAIKKTLLASLRQRGWVGRLAQDSRAALKGCLSFLSASQARVVLVNLEDLWLESEPQNQPGTEQEYPNWRRRARYSLEMFCQMPEVLDTLREINRLRRRRSADHDTEKRDPAETGR